MGFAELFSRKKSSVEPDKQQSLEGAAVQWRHEWKYELTVSQAAEIRSRIQAVAVSDPHAGESGKYRIRSLYFDNYRNDVLQRNLIGVSPREKFRIRYYNNDITFIRLEKKVKRNYLGTKFEEEIYAEEVQRILSGDMGWFPGEGRHGSSGTDSQAAGGTPKHDFARSHPLLMELYSKTRMMNLAPRVIVEYQREPYCFTAGNVRVTFDYDLRFGLDLNSFLNPEHPLLPAIRPLRLFRDFPDRDPCLRTGNGLLKSRSAPQASNPLPVGAAPVLMEVKWDRFLPGIIQDAIQTPGLPSAAFSKYVQCRAFG